MPFDVQTTTLPKWWKTFGFLQMSNFLIHISFVATICMLYRYVCLSLVWIVFLNWKWCYLLLQLVCSNQLSRLKWLHVVRGQLHTTKNHVQIMLIILMILGAIRGNVIWNCPLDTIKTPTACSSQLLFILNSSTSNSTWIDADIWWMIAKRMKHFAKHIPDNNSWVAAKWRYL